MSLDIQYFQQIKTHPGNNIKLLLRYINEMDGWIVGSNRGYYLKTSDKEPPYNLQGV